MTQQILFFPDAINFQAFILLEKIPPPGVNKEKFIIQLPLGDGQVDKACKLYGAVIRKN